MVDYKPFKLRKSLPPVEVQDSSSRLPDTVLDETRNDPAKQLPVKEIILRVVALAQVLIEKKFYPYQILLAYRIVESVLMHDGDTITSLMARQSGKTETLGGIIAAIAIILPVLANQYPDSWHLNITDASGNYHGFKAGVKIGIYAPRLDQSQITFERIKLGIESKSAKKVLSELGIQLEINNGNRIRLGNGSSILCESASENSIIEGETHHILIQEEAQDISDLKIKKSLNPMVSSTNGTIAMIGTAGTSKCEFYNVIAENRRMEFEPGGKQNHFFFPWAYCAKYNSLYGKYVEKEMRKIGADSDEFKMSYEGKWIFERGMFVTDELLFDRDIAQTEGLWSNYHWFDRPGVLKYISVVVGIDWGATSDSTVLCLMAVDWANPLESGESSDMHGSYRYTFYKKHVIGWEEFIGDNYEYQFGEIYERLTKTPNLKKIIMDSNACGKPLFDRFSAVMGPLGIEVEGFNFQPSVKSDGYKSLSADLSGRRITFPAGPLARNRHYKKFAQQMRDLKKEYKNRLMVVAHPNERGAHDDYPDSFMLASWGCNTPAMSGIIEASGNNPFL